MVLVSSSSPLARRRSWRAIFFGSIAALTLLVPAVLASWPTAPVDVTHMKNFETHVAQRNDVWIVLFHSAKTTPLWWTGQVQAKLKNIYAVTK